MLTSEGTKVTQGIVIQDREGNEFVWIPIDSVSTGTSKPADDIRLGRYTFDETNGTPKKEQDADNYTQIVNIRKNGTDFDYQEKTNDDENIAAKNLGDFVTKSKANGGYYLGRYEASEGADRKAKLQYAKTVWNNIKQAEAATIARTSFSNSYIESDILNSYSWDTAIVFIQKYSGNSNYSNKKPNNTSLLTTGKTEDKVCNIYDMASNCSEWSTEHCTRADAPCVDIGGIFYYPDATTASYRGRVSTTGSADTISFRIILNIK